MRKLIGSAIALVPHGQSCWHQKGSTEPFVLCIGPGIAAQTAVK